MVKTNAEKQKTYTERMKAAGYKRLVVWVPRQDLEDLKLVVKSRHAILRAKRSILKQLETEVKRTVAGKLERKTERALLSQARDQVRRQAAGANAPPARVQFRPQPPALIRSQIKHEGWLYDPVSCTWILPTAPDRWDRTLALLDQISRTVTVLKLAADPDNVMQSTIVGIIGSTKNGIDRWR